MQKNSRHKKTPALAGVGVLGNEINYQEEIVMSNNSTAISVDNLSIVRHAGRPVVSTALLAKLYGTDPKRIQNNFMRNADRFESGKHFFKVVGEDLADLRPSLGGLHVSPKARALILWTERGAARHAKMLETNEAWDVFERLEDCYFNTAESRVETLPAATSYTLIGTTIGSDGFHCLSAVIDGKISRLDKRAKQSARMHIWSQVHKAFSVVRGEDIPAEKLESAMNFVAAYAIEGQYLPKPAEPYFDVGQDGRYMLSFNHKGEQQITRIPDDAYVLSSQEFLKGIAHIPGDIPISTDDLFEFALAALSNLRLRSKHRAA